MKYDGAMELLIFLLLAQTAATLAAYTKFFLVNQQATWHQALTYCRERFTDLATIETEGEMARVTEMVGNSGSDHAWMGLYDDVDSWRWSMANTSLYAGGNTTFGDWINFQRSNAKSSEHCASVHLNTLYDNDCETLRRALCYDEPSNTYITVTEKMTWKSAQSYCRELYTDLASIRNKQEVESVLNARKGLYSYWIGLSRESWKWSDQSSSLFRKWAEGYPQGGSRACAGVSVNGMHDGPCESEIPFICSAPVKRMVKLVLKPDGNVDLNDPMIQEAILKQVEMDMKKAGIQQEIRVTWRK